MIRPLVPALALALALSTSVKAAPAPTQDWAPVAQALGKSGAVQPDGGYRVPLPRTDLHVTLDGVPLKAGFALGSWVAFAPMGKDAMVMGDLVLTETEVSPVMKSLADNGFQITALHNHLLRAAPATFYMHVMGEGDPVKLATTLHAALALSGTPFTAPAAAAPGGDLGIDQAAIDAIIGIKGKVNGGVLQYGVPRREPVRAGGMAVPTSLGGAIAINFQPTGEGKAAVTGDFVLAASEVNPVLRALRSNGIEVTAIHNHMLDEQPRMFFMHFWANDDAQKLARGLRAALDKAATVKLGS
jgi:hypothetical protein